MENTHISSSPLRGKVAIVTGSSRGIGAAIARRMAADGAAVAINYVTSRDAAEEMVAAIERDGGRAIALGADVSKREDVERLFAATLERFGGLDILVNNAGYSNMEPIPLADTTDELYDRVFDVNTRGTYLCMREAARHIRSGGRIINLSSTGTVVAHPGHSLYTAAKSAVEIFTRIMAKEMRGRNVTVNCVAPGATASEGWLKGKAEETTKMIAKLSPLNRLGTPDDIAAMIAFLVAPEGEWINAQVIRANGGFF